MRLNYSIEVAVLPETSTTERGRILERFARRFLETQNYAVQEEVRVTGSEVDLLATERTTAERVFVECKAHRSTISAEVLHKLLGNVEFHDYSSGWLISTFALSKDAKGFEDQWNQRPAEKRRKLRIYTPEKLIERLVQATIIFDPSKLHVDSQQFRASSDALFLLTKAGEYWAIPVLDPSSGVPTAALLFHATTGKRVSDQSVLDMISKTDTSLSLPWISESPAAQQEAVEKLRTELESIVSVPVADHWADYRPARPVDFIGRESTQSAVFQFFDNVRAGATKTRLVALKAPSGWGKSSTVLKIASKAANIRHRGKYYVRTVDSRAATTRRFPELAVVTAIKEAVNSGFIRPVGPLKFGGASSLFSTPAMQEVGTALREEGKLLCVFFDQFEELLYKTDLAEVFNEMRRICASVEEAQINIVIGFSWKTDGVIPTEHNAYHMWHSLADRRVEIELAPFSESEVALAINRFAKELGNPIIPQLRRLLQDHCQGFPWLLKKLCIHIRDLSLGGIEQLDILNRSVNIQTLFKKDLEALSSLETGCLKQIAAESPAEFFKIAQNFGDDVVSKLVDKRLIIRSGTKLAIYWDIFRDYILTERIPYIPVTYVPQANFSRYVKALIYMRGRKELSYSELAEEMSLGMGAADNLVRDLVNVGHVEANRKENRIVPTFQADEDAIDAAFSFWRSHEVVRRLSAGRAPGGAFAENEFIDVYRAANKRSEIGERTLNAYAQRVLRWLIGLGIAEYSGTALSLRDTSRSSIKSLEALGNAVGIHAGRGTAFLGEAPPSKAIAAYSDILNSRLSRQAIEDRHGRNTCYVLGLMRADGALLVSAPVQCAGEVIAERARASATIIATKRLLEQWPEASGLEVGKRVEEVLGANWSVASRRRYGTALRQWAIWTSADDPQPTYHHETPAEQLSCT